MSILVELIKALADSRRSGADGGTSKASPMELYRRTCEAVVENIFDPSAFNSTARGWEHRFDGRIRTDSQAAKCANELFAATGDPFTVLHSREDLERQSNEDPANYCGIGITCAPRHDAAGRPVVGSGGDALAEADVDGHPLVKKVGAGTPAQDAGLKPGDFITHLDGVNTSKERSLKSFLLKLRGKPGTQLDISVLRDGQIFNLTIARRHVQLLPVSFQLLDGGIGYIEFSEFSMQSANLVMTALRQLRDAKALIIDIRNNEGGRHTSAIDITSMFLRQGVLVQHKSRISGSSRKPEYRTVKTELEADKLVTTTTISGSNKPEIERSHRSAYMIGDRPVVLLVGEDTASSAEIFAGALKDNGAAVLIGTRTFGKGVGQITINMPNGAVLEVTNSRYMTPNGVWPGNGVTASSTGILPDINVEPQKMPFDAASADDNQLRFALDWLVNRLK